MERVRMAIHTQPGPIQSKRALDRGHHGVPGDGVRQRLASLGRLRCVRQVPERAGVRGLPVPVSALYAGAEFRDRRAVPSVPGRAGVLRVAGCATDLFVALHLSREEGTVVIVIFAQKRNQWLEDQSHGVLLHRCGLRRGIPIRPGLPIHRPHDLRVDHLDYAQERHGKPGVRGHVRDGPVTDDPGLEPDHRVSGLAVAGSDLGAGECVLWEYLLSLDCGARSALE